MSKHSRRGRLGRPKREALEWRQKDGKVVLITDMEDNHLINCLRMLKRAMKKQLKAAIASGTEYENEDWRNFLGDGQRERVYFMETECIKRGICWDPDGDIGGAGQISGEKMAARSEACFRCAMGAVCLVKKFVVRRCTHCKRCFVPMGGAVYDVIVEPDCPRRVSRKGKRFERWCSECAASKHIEG